MNIRLAYRGHSALIDSGTAQTLSLSPNLAREPVSFDAPLRQPLRFREAISALHDVVTSDLRFKKKDKTAYLAWKKQQAQRNAAQNRQVYQEAKKQALQEQEVPPELERSFEAARRKYWDARKQYSNYLYQHDQALWRKLMPCDPVITVADDVCFFECFSGDESSYGCLTVDRDGAFGRCENAQLGTTNVDYSWDLYHHFQGMRSYRDTRFRVDPQGFEVATQGAADYREEKIDLPAGWLRGFMQIQTAATLPATQVSLSCEAVYSILAWLKRHRAWTSPRAMRFELSPGRAPRIVMEPWEVGLDSLGTVYNGPAVPPIRIWGTRRLLVLARMLPLAESFDVYLLGTGLPSFWVAKMGDMRLTLGLSGWTTNDWTRAAAIDLMAPPGFASPELVAWTAEYLRKKRAARISEIESASGHPAASVGAAMRYLAHAGQAIYDLSAGLYRWRQIMPQALGEAEMGSEHEELAGLRQILANRPGTVESEQDIPGLGRLITGSADHKPVELLLDPDGRVKRGKCFCGYFRKYALKNGPCRHMMALRFWASKGQPGLVPPPPQSPMWGERASGLERK